MEVAGTRETIFVSTTSGLSITELGRRSATGPRLVGAHFWNPPHLMPLVEVIRGDDTQDGAFELIMDLVASIGKIPSQGQPRVPGSSAIVYCTLCGVRRSIWWAGYRFAGGGLTGGAAHFRSTSAGYGATEEHGCGRARSCRQDP